MDSDSDVLMKYGNQVSKQITNSELNKAKLQVVTYAFMRMVENEGSRFEQLSIDWIPNEYTAYNDNISSIVLSKYEIQAFLNMIKEKYKEENPEI
jgi:hypothetical protein